VLGGVLARQVGSGRLGGVTGDADLHRERQHVREDSRVAEIVGVELSRRRVLLRLLHDRIQVLERAHELSNDQVVHRYLREVGGHGIYSTVIDAATIGPATEAGGGFPSASKKRKIGS
jgi:hypothetical protein